MAYPRPDSPKRSATALPGYPVSVSEQGQTMADNRQEEQLERMLDPGSAPDQPQELTALGRGGGDQLAHLRQPVPELPVAHFHWKHRVLHFGDDVIGLLDGVNRPLQMDPRIGGGRGG